MEAEVEERNLGVEELNSDLEGILASTLGVDDYVDLDTFRIRPEHPPFDSNNLNVPIPAPGPMPDPPKPVVSVPAPPRGILGSLFGKKKHEAAIEEAQSAYERALRVWEAQLKQLEAQRADAKVVHSEAEARREEALARARATYDAECVQREYEAVVQNKKLDEFIANLSYGSPEAVQEYISIVLSNSSYPKHFPVEHEFTFDPSSAEMRLTVNIPGPAKVSDIKGYRYTRSADEITSIPMTQKACRDRYASVVNQVALRSLHEVFESDRRAIIKTISLEVGCHTLDPATGLPTYVPFVAVGAERETFLTFDLAGVVPTKTLERLGAAVSKNPHGLVAAHVSGVRRS